LCDSTEFDGAFGDVIGEYLELFGDLVEQFMQADEVRPFDVPMRLFELHLKVYQVG
jgi:hypothetical protein